MADGNFVYLTRERIVEIEKELTEMKTNGRKSMAEKIAEARALTVIFPKMLSTMLQMKSKVYLS